METKGLVQRSVIDEDREQSEDVEEMSLEKVNKSFESSQSSLYVPVRFRKAL